MAVHPSDAAKAEAAAKKLGFNIHFDRATGCPTFDSFSQRDRYIRTQGYHVKDRGERKYQ